MKSIEKTSIFQLFLIAKFSAHPLRNATVACARNYTYLKNLYSGLVILKKLCIKMTEAPA